MSIPPSSSTLLINLQFRVCSCRRQVHRLFWRSIDYLGHLFCSRFSLEIKKALEGLWSPSSVSGSQKSAEQFALSCKACGLPEKLTVGDIARHMLMIMLQDFMDPWTFNQKNLMK
jgi:hypothetical protein